MLIEGGEVIIEYFEDLDNFLKGFNFINCREIKDIEEIEDREIEDFNKPMSYILLREQVRELADFKNEVKETIERFKGDSNCDYYISELKRILD